MPVQNSPVNLIEAFQHIGLSHNNRDEKNSPASTEDMWKTDHGRMCYDHGRMWYTGRRSLRENESHGSPVSKEKRTGPGRVNVNFPPHQPMPWMSEGREEAAWLYAENGMSVRPLKTRVSNADTSALCITPIPTVATGACPCNEDNPKCKNFYFHLRLCDKIYIYVINFTLYLETGE